MKSAENNIQDNHLYRWAVWWLGLLVFIDVAGEWLPIPNQVLVGLWLSIYGLIMLQAGRSWVAVFRWAWLHRAWLLSLVIIGFLGLSIYGAFLPTSYSYETANEIGCALRLMGKAGFSWHQTCLYGYPARQFFLPALVPYLFGRSQVNLDLGPWLYFFLGLGIFIHGILQFVKPKKGSVAVILALAIFMNLYHLHMWLTYYEQSLYPFAFSMMLSGIYLSFEKNQSKWWVLLGALVLLHLSHAYTASLALVGLGLGIMVREVWKPRQTQEMREFVGALVMVVLVSVLMSLTYREDVNVGIIGSNSGSWQQTVIEGVRAFVLNDQPIKPMTRSLQIVVVPMLVVMLLGVWGPEKRWLGAWMAGVIMSSILFKGVAQDLVHFRMHKALVIFPVLALVLISRLKKSEWLSRYQRLLLIVSLVLAVTGIKQHVDFKKKLKVENDVRAVQSLRQISGLTETDSFELWYSPIFQQELTTLPQALSYFYPQAEVSMLPIDCGTRNTDDKQIFLVSVVTEINCAPLGRQVKPAGEVELYYQRRVKIFEGTEAVQF